MVNLPVLIRLSVPPVTADQRVEKISLLQLIWRKFFGILALDGAEC
jgi:hypothetical protein